MGSQSTISLHKAASMFVLYIQILGIQNWFFATLGLNFESVRFLSSFNSLKWSSQPTRQDNVAGEMLDSRSFCCLKAKSNKAPQVSAEA